MNKFTCLITPGRSGSTFLQTQLNRLPSVFAEESYYNLPGRKRRNCFSFILGKNEEDKNDFFKRKIEYIENLNCDHYIDTVSLICQDNNIERFIDYGYTPNVITLRRDPRLVAKSYYELRWSVISPPGSSVQPTDNEVIKMTLLAPHEYQECLWYCFEIERRARQYALKLEAWGVKHYETSLHRILNTEEFNSMMSFFDMPQLDSVNQELVNDLKEDKNRLLTNELAFELEEEFIENIKNNNDLDISFLNIDDWKF